jgi:hypothetical protein
MMIPVVFDDGKNPTIAGFGRGQLEIRCAEFA